MAGSLLAGGTAAARFSTQRHCRAVHFTAAAAASRDSGSQSPPGTAHTPPELSCSLILCPGEVLGCWSGEGERRPVPDAERDRTSILWFTPQVPEPGSQHRARSPTLVARPHVLEPSSSASQDASAGAGWEVVNRRSCVGSGVTPVPQRLPAVGVLLCEVWLKALTRMFGFCFPR